MTDIAQIELPRRPRGWPSPAVEAGFRKQEAEFCALIRQIQSSMDYRVGSRGWTYIDAGGRHGSRPEGRIPRKMRPPAGE